jgi:hypothetical protein
MNENELDKRSAPTSKTDHETELYRDKIQVLTLGTGHAQTDFWQDLDTILENCDEVMRRHGWDRKVKGDRAFPHEPEVTPFTEFWYAGRLGFECWHLLVQCRDSTLTGATLERAFNLGRILSEAEWSLSFKKPINTGMGVLRGAGIGGNMRIGRLEPQTKVTLGEMSRLISESHSIRRAAELTFKKGLGRTADANRKLWQRHNKLE